MRLESVLGAPTLEHRGLDLDSAERVLYVLEQSFTYSYTQPIYNMRQQLVVIPRLRHGAQHRRAHRLDVTSDSALRRSFGDVEGNSVVRIDVEQVKNDITFGVAAVIERVRSDGPLRVSRSAAENPRLLIPTRLTEPDDRLRQLAHDTVAGVRDPLERAELLNQATKTAITYEYGRTGVRTTAAEALQLGFGVCQDSAHVFITMCRLLGIPARYVSGHLLGQGGTHAWAEVAVPDGSTAGDDTGSTVVAFDPCNNRRAHSGYVTVAVGRDYRDVAPTSGSYDGPGRGSLTTSRRVGVLDAS
ncbi:MAG: transglutaminase protein [Pseudonocardiales bacterium]|nr:transglutaminase protein [Pseudonocardiales bacterium]